MVISKQAVSNERQAAPTVVGWTKEVTWMHHPHDREKGRRERSKSPGEQGSWGATAIYMADTLSGYLRFPLAFLRNNQQTSLYTLKAHSVMAWST